MSEAPRLLVIGLDGGTFDLLDPLMERGYMPNLAALRQRGCWGPLASTVPPFTAAAWSSLITGYNPGRHGILTFTRRDRYNYDTSGSGFVNAQRFPITLWEVLSAAGKRVGVVNVPLTYPPRPVNGFLVTGMLTPPDAERFTYPAAFATHLGADYQVDVDFIRDGERFRRSGLPPKDEMLPQIARMTAARAEVCARLVAEEPWDFFMVVFTGTDRIFHFFWDDLVSWRDGDGAETARQKQLLAYFRDLDRGIGVLLDEAGPGSSVFVLSDHGFGPAPRRRFYVNVWLEQLGLLHARGAEGLLDLDFWRVRLGRIRWLKAALRRVLPQEAQDAVQSRTTAVSQKSIFDWSRTRAYFVPVYFHVCGVEANLTGERREGIVAPGADYEAVRDQVIAAAAKVRDPQTGKPVVALAARREELYEGPYVADFPDVLLVLNPDYVASQSLAGSSLFEPHPHPIRPGEHREDGIFLAAGPHVLAQQEPFPNLRLLDTPATMLYAMELPVPADYDGRVLAELFAGSYREQHPVRYTDSVVPAQRRDDDALSETEESGLAERLRGLGYLE